MTKILRAELRNWMPFGGVHVLDDIPSKPIAIIANYVTNPRRSNWAGKTAFLEAFKWAFHGVHRKRLDDSIITNGTQETAVIITLDDGGNLVVIDRSRPRGGPTKLLVTEGETTYTGEAAQAAIHRILGLDEVDFDATIVFAQGDTEAIVGMRSGERRKIISKWLELDVWDRLLARARVTHRDISTRLAALDAAADIEVRDPFQLDEALTTSEAAESDAKKVVADLERRVQAIEQLDRFASYEDDYENTKLQAKEAFEAIRALGAPPESSEALRASFTTASTAEQVARTEHDAAKRLVTRGFDGGCPVMLAPCPAKDHVIAASDLAKKRFAGAAEQLNGAEAARAAIQRDMQARDASDRQRASRTSSYNALVARVRELKMKIDSPECIAAREQAAACDVTRVDALGRSGASHSVRLELRAAREAYGVAKSNRDRADYDVKAQESVLKRIEEREVKKKAMRSEMRAAELVVRAFGPTGIPARIAAQQLISLEDRANALLSGTGLSFTLGWERETRDAAPICYECGYAFKGKKEKTCPSCDAARGMKRSDELEILVDSESGEVEDVRTASGGAKVLVASAIRLAGGLMLRELRGSRVAWALVDEPFGALDAENREQLARTFAGMLGSVGLEQAFVVSHDAALLDALPSKIQITRDGSKSRISLER